MRFTVFIVLGLLLAACAPQAALPVGDGLPVVATNPILADVVSRVGGEHVSVTTLIPAGVDPHAFEATPQDIAKLDAAALVFINGLHLEESLEPLLHEAEDAGKLVTASEGIEALAFEEGHAHEDEHADHDHEHEGEHHHEEADDLSIWAGDWLSTTAYEVQDFEPAFDEVVNLTPELTAEQVRSYFHDGYHTSFDSFLVDGTTVTFTSEAGGVSCEYSYEGTTPVLQVAGAEWSVFETESTGCGEYRHLLLSPPHAVEAEAVLHFHMIYGDDSPEHIAEESGIWVPSLYPADTQPAALVNMWLANARLLGLYIAQANGIEVAMTAEEHEALEAATGEHDHEHEGEHAHEDEHDHEGEHAHEDEHGHSHHGEDPHVWWNPANINVWVDNIAAALSAADPANAASYQANADAYKAELAELDAWIVEQVASLPAANRKLVVDHQSLNYFAERYGFESVGALVASFSTLSEASAGELAELEHAMEDLGVRAIFVGNSTNPSLAERVSADTGVQVVPLYIETLSPPDGPARSYIEMMRYNVSAIIDALK